MKLTYLPAYITGAVLAILIQTSLTYHRAQGQGQGLAERIKALNAEKKPEQVSIQQPGKTKHESIVLWWFQYGDSHGFYIGAKVFVSSGSKGAPSFPHGSDVDGLVELGEAIAQLQDLDYTVNGFGDGWVLMSR